MSIKYWFLRNFYEVFLQDAAAFMTTKCGNFCLILRKIAFYEMGQSLLQTVTVTVTKWEKKHSLKKMKINWPTFSILRKSEKTRRFKNMYFYERVTRELQTLHICKPYILHVLVVTASAI